MILPHNIYIHVPFCISKCNYCAFFSCAIKPDWEKYTKNIIKEIDFWESKLGNFSVPTIFFGGGTPSLMPVDVFDTILTHLNKKFNFDTDIEITIEANPKTIDNEKLSDFIQIGVNRLSIGVQSLDDTELAFLGRKHNSQDAMNLLEYAMTKNIRVSGDFIYGLPGHNVDSVIKICKQINSLGLKHVSMYELTIEKSTPFGKMNLNMPDNKTMADMYNAIPEHLKIPRYEVSNYAIIGNECKHNLNIWDGQPYIGIGQGAAGRPYINNQWFEQLGNFEKLDILDDNARATEKIITGLRTVRGVKLTDDVKKNIDFDFLKKSSKLVGVENHKLKATPQGMLFLDDLIVNLIR